ncbi:protein EMSY-LIKE 4-like isoform X1 [Salvia splendens]|uniref:protein EMSY-LIKE 4-like isoform X1 n=1 Tax=Salvia splendens TaxID=180675 RepID=UPI001C261E5C|nr:protein EMSY-LIKE 4-like isoform X1 [Salvia splendens]
MAVTRDCLQAFYNLWYFPSLASITGSGTATEIRNFLGEKKGFFLQQSQWTCAHFSPQNHFRNPHICGSHSSGSNLASPLAFSRTQSSGYNRGTVGGRVAGNERSFLPSAPFQMSQMDMEYEIHNLEQIAYDAVLRAFKAQSDTLTWETEGLITELRKELRVPDDEHRELLSQVNGDDLIRRIREWREAGGNRNIAPNVAQHINNQLPSPTISASRNMLSTFGID